MKNYVFDERHPFYSNEAAGVRLYRGICKSRNDLPVIIKRHAFNPGDKGCDKDVSRAFSAAVFQAKAHHPHTCEILDVQFVGDRDKFVVFHVLESLESTLNEEIEQRSDCRNYCTEEELRNFLLQTSAALAYTHSKVSSQLGNWASRH